MSFDTCRTCELLVVDEDHLCSVLLMSQQRSASMQAGIKVVVEADFEDAFEYLDLE